MPTLSKLGIRCRKHPNYTAKHKPHSHCWSCGLLYVLRYQHSDDGPEKLGNLNAYAYYLSGIDYHDALDGLEVSDQVTITA